MKWLSLILWNTFLHSTTRTIATSIDENLEEGGITRSHEKPVAALIEWLQSNSGIIHPSLEIRHSERSDPDSKIGIFATDFIPADSLLLQIPNSIMIRGGSSDEDNGETLLPCQTVRNLAKELKLQDASTYAPYVHYLLENPPEQTPSAWSETGQDLLNSILQHGNGSGDFILPPAYPTDWIADDWINGCNDGELGDPYETLAVLLVVQKSIGMDFGEGPTGTMVPFYDMIKHKNISGQNAAIQQDGNVSTQHAMVWAVKDIQKGKEIYAPTCHKQHLVEENNFGFYGSPEIFRDCGIVEDYPQDWYFEGELDRAFRVDYGDPTNSGHVLSAWIDGKQEPSTSDLRKLKHLLDHLIKSKKVLLLTSEQHPKVPQNEWNAIKMFCEAMEIAITTALRHNGCIDSGTCSISSFGDRYIDLEKKKLVYLYDDGDDDPPTCDDEVQSEPFSDGTFKTLEEIHSPYQKLSYIWNPANRDTCLDIDGTIQICDSYRPHYHELSVHNAARYLKNPKRFLWVGGGDSMLLHEFLKYPDLELAVGLELDQRVPRSSFKHFGSQPHFDNDKVEWWFGDATKSIMMLPEHYFGSFDMVVVDLSETVMSFSVTNGLDVIEALTLLLKPDGIFVKNEIYFGKFKQMFPQSLQIHWYDNPFVCSQVMVMGSRSINFMNPNLTDHGVQGFLIEPFDEVSDPYHLYHDFGRNENPLQICESVKNLSDNDVNSEQSSSPGIIFIVEAENAKFDLSKQSHLKDTITDHLENKGFRVLFTDKTKSEDGSHIILLTLSDGYIIARCVPEHKYCGFDIHFWSNLDNHGAVKDALAAAVMSDINSLSTFRVIAGGLFGLPSWTEDEKIRGPQFAKICREFNLQSKAHFSVANKALSESINNEITNAVLEMSVKLIDRKGKNIVVLVGDDEDRNTGDELRREILNNLEDVGEVNLLNCPSMNGFNEYEKDGLDAALNCEKQLKANLQEFSQHKKIDILIIGASANMHTSSVLFKAVSGQYNSPFQTTLEENLLILSTKSGGEESSQQWRGPLVQLFKNDIFVDEPATYTEITFRAAKAEGGSVKLLLSINGDHHFIQRLNYTVNNFQEESNFVAEFEMVDGGRYLMQENFVPTHHFLPDDYDQEPPLKQWNSQQPLGHQIIFQMEPDSRKSVRSPTLNANVLRTCLERAISKTLFPGLVLDSSMDDIISAVPVPGDGCMLSVLWPSGSIIVLWDGREHVDVNLFTFEQDLERANNFDSNFRFATMLKTKLRDEQPRGIGRVVSYFNDLGWNVVPHWS